MRLLLAELAPRPADAPSNARRIGEVLASATCDVAVFPELFLSGYRIGDRFHQVALHPSDSMMTTLSEIARVRRTPFVVGAPMQSSARAGEIHNAAVLFRPDGTVAQQTKRFLPTYGPFEEGSLFTATRESHPVELASQRVGLQICYDAFFPEVSRDLALEGAELLLIISSAPVTSRKLFEKVLPARAVENACPVVYVNRVGVEDGVVFGGGSGSWDARGEPLKGETVPLTGASQEEHVWLVDIDLKDAARWRPFRPVLRDIASHRLRGGDP